MSLLAASPNAESAPDPACRGGFAGVPAACARAEAETSLPAAGSSPRRGVHRCRLPLRHAGVREVAIRWELCGPADAPLLIVAGGISAHRHVIANPLDARDGWWQAQSALLARHRLLAIDWLGDGAGNNDAGHGDNDGTCHGLDAPIDSADQADAIAAVLDALALPKAHAFIGASYGAMVGLQFAARHPRKLASLIAISGAHRAHPWASALRSVQRKIIALGAAHGDATAGVALARQLAMLSYRTPVEFSARFAAPAAIVGDRAVAAADDYLHACGQRALARFDAASYLRLSESIDLHRIEPEAVRVPLSVIAIDSDLLVPREDLAELAVRAPDAWLQVIASRYGHDAFLKETAAIAAALHAALDA